MARKKMGNKVNGWVLLDKPADMTSQAATNAVKNIFYAQKAGHAGTLDPLATGMLPIALGEATKTIPYMMGDAKEYKFTIRWGIETDSHDSDGDVVKEMVFSPNPDDIRAVLPLFIGKIQQQPPQFSAIKINGKRAYDLARKGHEVDIPLREVDIYDFQLLSVDDAKHASFCVSCGSGTYIRALARDVAVKLGGIGHVSRLQRTKVGFFCLENAILLEELKEKAHKATEFDVLQPIEAGLDGISVITLDGVEAANLRNGRPVSLLGWGNMSILEQFTNGEIILAMGEDAPLGMVCYEKGSIKAKRLFNMA